MCLYTRRVCLIYRILVQTQIPSLVSTDSVVRTTVRSRPSAVRLHLQIIIRLSLGPNVCITEVGLLLLLLLRTLWTTWKNTVVTHPVLIVRTRNKIIPVRANHLLMSFFVFFFFFFAYKLHNTLKKTFVKIAREECFKFNGFNINSCPILFWIFVYAARVPSISLVCSVTTCDPSSEL